jgi:hypothetical protein
VGASDFVALAAAFGKSEGQPGYDEDLDADGNGSIGTAEYILLVALYGQPPGPSGLGCAGTIPCPDSDADGVLDSADNCLADPNPDQRDTNLDGYGNVCDTDYDGDGMVGTSDFISLVAAFGAAQGQPAYQPDLDFDGDGSIGNKEYILLSSDFGAPPGPSGFACAGTPPCPLP